MEIIKNNSQKENLPTTPNKIQTYLMNTISLRGVLFIGVIFMFLVIGITMVSVFTPAKYLVVEKPLWNCTESTDKFDSTKCDGWDSYSTIKSKVLNK